MLLEHSAQNKTMGTGKLEFSVNKMHDKGGWHLEGDL